MQMNVEKSHSLQKKKNIAGRHEVKQESQGPRGCCGKSVTRREREAWTIKTFLLSGAGNK